MAFRWPPELQQILRRHRFWWAALWCMFVLGIGVPLYIYFSDPHRPAIMLFQSKKISMSSDSAFPTTEEAVKRLTFQVLLELEPHAKFTQGYLAQIHDGSWRVHVTAIDKSGSPLYWYGVVFRAVPKTKDVAWEIEIFRLE